MKRAILSTVIFFISCFLFHSTALATGWGHSHSGAPRVHNLADIMKSGEIVGVVDFCGIQGTNGVHVDLVGESFQAVLGVNGTFKLRYVPRGAYTLRVSIPGQPDHTQPVIVKKRKVTDVGSISLCPDNDGDGFSLAEDCNDNNGDIFPGAEELCDGIDNDCDGVVDGPGCNCTDADNDSFFAQEGCGTAVDCNDEDDTIKPGAQEICDGIDNNCDNTIDEGFDLNTDLSNCGACTNVCSGICQAGQCFAVCGNGVVEDGEECDDGNTIDGDGCQADCTLPVVACPGNVPVGGQRPCDGPDTDFCTNGLQTCNADGQFGECVETITDIVEICNGIDDDCDGDTDEDFPEVGQPCSVGVGQCEQQTFTVCSNDGTGTQCNAIPGPPSPEICNGLDDDCNGQIDENNVCSTCGNGIIEPGEECDGGPCCNPGCGFASSSTICRPAFDACDIQETCTGNSANCPTDQFASSGTACGSQSSNACNFPDTCNGSGVCQQNFAPEGTECPPNTCNGSGSCRTTCSSDGQCASQFFCDSGFCQAQKGLGGSCDRDAECLSGICTIIPFTSTGICN